MAHSGGCIEPADAEDSWCQGLLHLVCSSTVNERPMGVGLNIYEPRPRRSAPPRSAINDHQGNTAQAGVPYFFSVLFAFFFLY
jgi:hypothetical protein